MTKVDRYDYTAYPTGGENPQRPSTMKELATWMNTMSRSVGSGIYHWVTENQIHWAKRKMDDGGQWLDEILDWGLL